MNITLKYSKAIYETKISELEGYHRSLAEHLETMEKLKEDMYHFWDDENARKAGKALSDSIRQVRNAMSRTNDMIILYRNTVGQMSAVEAGTSQALEESQVIISSAGI